ncbi:hypothetical protein BC832DRAFT_37901 [Gaertneriomyces semiglobifer]|nr:hypothetical protein BC832DRAFT_37901 [Gaertneriomyces semiglobifer]
MSSTIVYNATVKQINQLREDLERLQGGSDTTAGLQGQITAGLASLQRSARELDEMARREVTPVKREKALAHSRQVKEDYAAMQEAFSKWKQNERAKAMAREREELLGPGSIHARTASTVKPAEGADSSIFMMNHMLKENQVLGDGNHRISEMIDVGRNALQELYEQRDILKGAQRRMYDVANSLGLSTTVMRFIERRSAADKWILFGGITVTLILMWAIVHYFG